MIINPIFIRIIEIAIVVGLLIVSHWLAWVMGWGRGVENSAEQSIRRRSHQEPWFRDAVKREKEDLFHD